MKVLVTAATLLAVVGWSVNGQDEVRGLIQTNFGDQAEKILHFMRD